jgi:hypothetical protein
MDTRRASTTCLIVVLCVLLAHTTLLADEPVRNNQVVVLKGIQPPPEEPLRRVYFSSQLRSEEDLKTVRARLTEVGAWRIDTFYPDAIVCKLPVSVEPWSLVRETNVSVYTEDSIARAPAAQLPRRIGAIRKGYENSDKIAVESPLFPADLPALRPDEYDYSALPVGGRTIAQDPPLIKQTSEILVGRILVNLVFPESKGDDTQENWTQQMIETVVDYYVGPAMLYWERHFHNTPLHFDYNIVLGETQYEPITMPVGPGAGKQDPWIIDVLERLGYHGDQESVRAKVHRMNAYYLERYTLSDWVFTVFVVNAQNDADHAFDDSKGQLWGELGGPFVVLPFPAGFMSGAFENWLIYLMTIVFWGMGEDLSSPWMCGQGQFPYVPSRMNKSGYLNVRHGNKVYDEGPFGSQITCEGDIPVSCTAMLGDIEYGYTGPPCDFTLGMLGHLDNDRDNVPDALDAAPMIYFDGAVIDTLVSMDQPVNFRAVAQAVPNRNSQQTDPALRRDYVTMIKDASYSINNSIPVPVQPVDGAIDELEEEFQAFIAFMLPGESMIEVTARNEYGAKSELFTKTLYYIGLDFNSFRLDQTNDGMGVGWLMRGETFGADFELHRINFEADSADVVVASGIQPVGPKQDGMTPFYVYDNDVVPGTEYRYYVKGEFVHWYQGADRIFTVTSDGFVETAAVPREDGIMSYAVPNPYRPVGADGDMLVSVSVPGAVGIPMLSNRGAMSPAATSDDVPEPIGLSVGVYDVAGRRVKVLFNDHVFDEVVNVWWDGKNEKGQVVSSGIYFIKAQVGDVKGTQKVLILR